LGVFFASVALILFCVACDLETAKLAGVNPKTYLLEATHAALENPGTALLPHAPRT